MTVCIILEEILSFKLHGKYALLMTFVPSFTTHGVQKVPVRVAGLESSCLAPSADDTNVNFTTVEVIRWFETSSTPLVLTKRRDYEGHKVPQEWEHWWIRLSLLLDL